MTDLFQAAAPAPTPGRMTLAQQALVNLVGAWALTLFVEERPDLEQMIAQLLPAARHDVPAHAAEVVAAAEAIVRCAAADLPRGHVDWFAARMQAAPAMIRFLTRRGVGAMRACAEQPNPEGAANA